MRDEVRKSWGPMGWFQRSNKKIVIGVLVVVIAIGALMGTSLRGALTYYVTVDELKAEGSEAFGYRFRVGGPIQRGSMQRAASNHASFRIAHPERPDHRHNQCASSGPCGGRRRGADRPAKTPRPRRNRGRASAARLHRL